MSENTEPTQEQEAQEPTEVNEAKQVDMVTFVNFMSEFAKDGLNPITVLEDDALEDGSINVEINDDFATMFETAFPNADLQEAIQSMIEMIVSDYITEEGVEDLVGTETDGVEVTAVDEEGIKENIPLV